ncbi:hypothetical protein BCR43DRAFT_525773 [Syncephalastrum racemosum]|uniref:Uncharacterized protein n=1 Tax=Syncephalastrum racemosum TaxID=13706 RepID=A0A1X2H7Q7_SYNRA|nr:hypothetical protein BCR43DRAFT_525773 [Syncephalastrum racemosum]
MASHQNNPVLEHQHPPARMAGGMRVKRPNPDRVPLKAEEQHEEDEQNVDNEEQEREEMEAQKEFRERQKYEMQATQMSHQNALAGSQIRNSAQGRTPNYNPNFQQRSFNH